MIPDSYYGFNKATADDDQVVYQATVNNMCLLSANLNLKLNPNKCNELTIHLRNKKCNIDQEHLLINNVIVPRVENVKYLGLVISSDLSWSKHVSLIVKRVNYSIKNLTSFIIFMEKKVQLQIFNTLILPIILYGVEVWGTSLLQKDRKRLRKTIKYYAIVSSIKKQELINITNKQFYQRISKCAEKIRSNPTHPLNSKLTASHQRQTRHCTTAYYCRTETYKRTFIPTMRNVAANNDSLVFI